MDETVKKFAKSYVEVIKQMTNIDIKVGKIYIKDRLFSSFDYSFIVGVTGFLEGAVTMSIEENTAFYLASAMMGNIEIVKFDEMAESALCELANMTVANSLVNIGKNGSINITPPTFIRGSNVSLGVSNVSKTYTAALISPGGDVEFNISLKTNKDQ